MALPARLQDVTVCQPPRRESPKLGPEQKRDAARLRGFIWNEESTFSPFSCSSRTSARHKNNLFHPIISPTGRSQAIWLSQDSDSLSQMI